MSLIKNKTKGFTLIELLVVISIISLISSIVFASLSSARGKARNAARMESIHTLVTAFNLSLTENGTLPLTDPDNSNVWACVSETCYGTWVNFPPNAGVDSFLAPSLPAKPDDPRDGTRKSGGQPVGGFLYVNPLNYGAYPPGAYINWLLEPGGSCGPWLDMSNMYYTSCLRRVD